jgi:hypothetical protein
VGVPVGYAAAHAAFQHVWWALAAVAALAAVTALGMTPKPERRSARDSVEVVMATNG